MSIPPKKAVLSHPHSLVQLLLSKNLICSCLSVVRDSFYELRTMTFLAGTQLTWV